MSVLASIAQPDAEAQRKYEAMGLPDPVAFAALTALGAVSNPMGLLNAMMTKAQEKIESHAEREKRDTDAGAPIETASSGQALVASADANEDSVAATVLPEAPRRPAVERLADPPPIAVPPGKSFVEAFQDLQKAQSRQVPPQEEKDDDVQRQELEKLEERLKTQVKEVAEQAKLLAEHNREFAQVPPITVASRDPHGDAEAPLLKGLPPGVAQFFSSGADDEMDDAGATARHHMPASKALPLPTTLSGLLSGGSHVLEVPAIGYITQSSVPDKLMISPLPMGVTETSVRMECARYGIVSSLVVHSDSATAYVGFATADMASAAARGMANRPGLLGGTDQVEVKLIAEFPDSVRFAAAALPQATLDEPHDPSELPEHLKPREDRDKPKRRRRSASRSRRRSKSRRRARKKKRSRSMVRWLDRSRSNSHTATGQYIRATGYSSNVKWWEKKRCSSSSSGSDSAKSRRGKHAGDRRKEEDVDTRRPRQIAIKGHLAEFAFSGQHYFYNLGTGESTWERPKELQEGSSRRALTEPSKTSMML